MTEGGGVSRYSQRAVQAPQRLKNEVEARIEETKNAKKSKKVRGANAKHKHGTHSKHTSRQQLTPPHFSLCACVGGEGEEQGH